MDPEVGDFILVYVVREVTGLHQVAAVIIHQEEFLIFFYDLLPSFFFFFNHHFMIHTGSFLWLLT